MLLFMSKINFMRKILQFIWHLLKKRFIPLFLIAFFVVSCGAIRRTYVIKGEAEKVKFEYKDSVQQFNDLK